MHTPLGLETLWWWCHYYTILLWKLITAYAQSIHIAIIFTFIFCSVFCFLSLIYSRSSALYMWRSTIRCDTFTLAPRWSGSIRDRVNVVEYIGTMVLYVWFTYALLQLTSLMTDVNSLCKSSVGWAQSSCWQIAWMNHVPEISQQWINQLTMLWEPNWTVLSQISPLYVI